ncbi:hypothetical protein Xcel_0843 [Xylanimonas cellulosilytica DSM 15894]|uniref:MinD-like ATPase involved in chromosome partitioning or flagellar assembly n=1 Tax=Xylanimonas cellulosilytica (strain DSM 15894 / JCM 12276 / CECT 5975 / KCTC 9989 / LMG 20990 / NBRC 107835 / XIL07) TaxID=446471 RepID=D1BY34_XYLCX|nr:hypothetical protein [Xylanimonas cellulosilytica]ACZ29877.1 hypothetical protein Xcel_0843 [Xylanimonas cellulosilytica DSM 15894]
MTVIALCSAKGAPGVSTTALGLAMVWPRPVLFVEADPSGGNWLLAGFFRGAREYDDGLVELAISPLATADALRDVVHPFPHSSASFVLGVQNHAQAGGLRPLWQPLAEALGDLDAQGQDVIVDAGQLGLQGSPDPLLAWADLTLLVARTSLSSLSGARSRAGELGAPTSAWRQAGLLLVGEGRPYGAKDAARSLGLPVVATVAFDAAAAAVYADGATPPRRFDQGPYVRSLRAAADRISAAITRRREELTADVVEGAAP